MGWKNPQVLGLQHFYPLEVPAAEWFFSFIWWYAESSNLVNQLGKPSNEILLHLKMYNKTTLMVTPWGMKFAATRNMDFVVFERDGRKSMDSLLEQGWTG